MKQNSKILAAYVKICTHFCFVAFIEKHGAKDLFILARKLGENLLHYFLVLFRRERYLRIGASIGRIRSIAFIVNGNIGPRPEIFEKDVVANRVHEGAKPFRVLQTLLAAKGYEYPENVSCRMSSITCAGRRRDRSLMRMRLPKYAVKCRSISGLPSVKSRTYSSSKE